MSHTVGGVSKLRSEQQKLQEEHEKEQYKRFLAQFTMENFLEKVLLQQQQMQHCLCNALQLLSVSSLMMMKLLTT